MSLGEKELSLSPETNFGHCFNTPSYITMREDRPNVST